MADPVTLANLAESGRLDELRVRARRHAEQFRLPLRNRTWRGQTGDFAGANIGSSLDFHDHRTYLAGDDPRHINWQAYARTGNYTMKQYREEVRPLVDLVFDVSSSLFLTPAKAERSIELYYFIIESAWQEAASLAVFLVHGNQFFRMNDESLHGHAWQEHRDQQLTPGDPSEPPAVWKVPFRAGSMRVLISDLLFPGEVESIAASLAVRQGRPMILTPFCREESDVDWSGNHEFIDCELATHHLRRVDERLLHRYLKAYKRHFDYWRAISQKHGTLCCRVPADASFEEAIRLEAIPAGAVEFGIL
ncbi:MAG: DUF58 domain-containing protein [Verrucomicrobiota bacterium]